MNALKAFDAAARRRGFTAAAQELSVSPGAISRHVANLEEHFGVNLFERHHNEIHLTKAGEQYYVRIRSALDVIEDASRRMVEETNPRQLTISALPTFATHWLVPRLPDFLARHPKVEVQLLTTVAQLSELDFEMGGLDVALHFSISDVASETCDFLFETELQAVCSPDLARSVGEFSKPADIAGLTLLHTVHGLTLWRQWFEAAGLSPSLAGRSVKFGNTALALQAAVDGVGLAIAETAFVERAVDQGRLVSPFPQRVVTGNKYFMSVNPARAKTASVVAFRAWMLEKLMADVEGGTAEAAGAGESSSGQ